LSMLLGIAILNFQGTSLNMMVLFSLILALGMLVDNGIVVVENIYRWRTDLGYDNNKSSKFAVGEVALPIIVSTATTVAAFVPLLFWKDLMGEFMKYLPITLIIVLSASVFVALVVNPVLTKYYMKTEKDVKSKPAKFWRRTLIMLTLGVVFKIPFFTGVTVQGFMAFINIVGGILLFAVLFSLLYRFLLLKASDNFREVFMPKLENYYSGLVAKVLKRYRPIYMFIAMFVLLIGSIMFFGASNPNVLFFPENDPLMVNVFIEAPLGTDIEQTDIYTKEIEKIIKKAIKPYDNIVEAVLAQVGEKTSDPNEGPQPGSSPHKARVTVTFYDYEKRVSVSDVSTKVVLDEIREAVKNFPYANITVSKDKMGPPVGKPINLEVKGEDYEKLIVIVEQLKKMMEQADVPGVDKLKTDMELDKQEILLKVNRDAASRYGVSTGQIATTLRTALLGKEISKYKEGEDDYPIQLRLSDEYRYNLNNLLNMRVTFRNNMGTLVQVPISAVCEVDFDKSTGTVKRIGMERVVTIFSEVKDGYSPTAIVDQFKSLLSDYPLPKGFSMKFTGELEEQDKSSSFLMGALMFAVMLIFLLLVSQFNSVVYPLIILVSVLFSTIGVFLGFGLTGMDFVILMCGIGIISLAGVVVNNSIVLIDYTNILKKQKKLELGLDEEDMLPTKILREVIADAGKTRLRPVLLTAITTVLGLLPLALGMNINFATLLSHFQPNFYLGGDSTAFWGPMAWTIMFGLTFATFLTLVMVPVMILISDKMLMIVKGKK
jgi:multidrug efflux pump